MMSVADFVCHFFNILIGSLRFFRIDHINIVIADCTARISFYLISVEYQDQMHPAVTLIVAQNIHQPASGAVQIDLRQLF